MKKTEENFLKVRSEVLKDSTWARKSPEEMSK